MSLIRRRHSRLLALLAGLGLVESGYGAKPESDVEGKVRFYNVADSDFDVYSYSPTEEDAAWMRAHYLRMQTYETYFDSRLSWYPDAWVYKDAYAIKPTWPVFGEHPEWILKDASENLLYIPWGCSGGTCPQYAGDVGNPAFRAHWIAEARALIDLGYRGLWVDDVNLAWRVSDGYENFVAPIDPRTGEEMRYADWRRYFAEFMEEIRKAFPDTEIAHNAIWYAGPTEDPYIRRQIEAADYYNFERGATDAGLEFGRRRFGFETFLSYVDSVHALGTSVIFMDYGTTTQQREFGLAAWFLISDGSDMMSSNQLAWTAPGNWWPGYDLDLGAAKGHRYSSGSLIVRDYACGIVILNQPDAPRVDYELDDEATNLSGDSVTSVRLGGGEATILTRPCESIRRPRAPGNLSLRIGSQSSE